MDGEVRGIDSNRRAICRTTGVLHAPLNKKGPQKAGPFLDFGGERGIRTPGPDKGTTVFKTAAFDRSASSPLMLSVYVHNRADKRWRIIIIYVGESSPNIDL